jgi:hypothetical protein
MEMAGFYYENGGFLLKKWWFLLGNWRVLHMEMAVFY